MTARRAALWTVVSLAASYVAVIVFLHWDPQPKREFRPRRWDD